MIQNNLIFDLLMDFCEQHTILSSNLEYDNRRRSEIFAERRGVVAISFNLKNNSVHYIYKQEDINDTSNTYNDIVLFILKDELARYRDNKIKEILK
jgi:hypothetical protein